MTKARNIPEINQAFKKRMQIGQNYYYMLATADYKPENYVLVCIDDTVPVLVYHGQVYTLFYCFTLNTLLTRNI